MVWPSTSQRTTHLHAARHRWIGLGIGGQRYSLIMLFETEDRLDKFVGGRLGLPGDSGSRGRQGRRLRAVELLRRVAFYQITEKGLMAHADVSGTKFWINDELR